MKKSVLLFFVLCGFMLNGAVELGNVPLKYIVLPADAPDTVRLAAKELQKFINRVSRDKLEIVAESPAEQGAIYLGSRKDLLAKVKREGYRIVGKKGNLYISGHDSPSGAVVGIRNPWRRKEVYNEELKLGVFGETGTLNGVYYFLEKFGGVRFYWPGEVGTVVPSGKKISVPAGTDLVREPVYNCRYVWLCDFNEAPEDALWFRRAGFGGIAPVQILDYNWFFTGKLKNSHPEIFAKVNGKPDFGAMCAIRGGGHLCYTHPNTVPLVSKLICEYFDRNPQQRYFPMLPGDGLVRVCECKNCQAEVNHTNDRSEKFTDHIWGFINKVAAEVSKKHPDKFIGCSAYDSYAAPPLRIKKFHPNVVVQFGKNRGAMAAPAYEKFVRDRIAKWQKVTANALCGWDFYLQCQIPWRGLPCLFSKTIQKDIKAMVAAGFVADGIEAESWKKNQPHKLTYPATQHLNLYITGRLYWEPDMDLEAFFDEYCRLFYGPAAKTMRTFWQICEKRWMEGHKNASGFSIFEIVRPDQVFDEKTINKLSALLTAARRQVPAKSVYAKRLEQLAGEFAIGKATVVVMVRNTPPQMTAVKEKEAIKTDGILSEKTWQKGQGAFMVGYCGEKPQVNTLVYSRNDGKNLHFAFVLAEPFTNKLKAACSRRDDGKMYLEDGVEIFLMPHPNLPKTGYQFIINSKGLLWDARRNEDRTMTVPWNSNAKVGVKVFKNRWCIEFSVPLQDIGVTPGQTIKANFYRNRVLDKKGGVSSCWSPIMTEGHFSPSRFGTLLIE